MNFDTLKSLVQIFWSQIKPFIKFTVTLYLKLSTLFAHFFTETFFGYTFYLFCIHYGLFASNEITLANTLAGWFAFLVIVINFKLWILVNIPITRKWLHQLVGGDYMIKYLKSYY